MRERRCKKEKYSKLLKNICVTLEIIELNFKNCCYFGFLTTHSVHEICIREGEKEKNNNSSKS